MVMYTVERRIGNQRIRLARCTDFAEAARIIDADAQLQEEGCVYEVTKEDEHEPDKESA